MSPRFEVVAGSGDKSAALGDGDATEERRRGHGAAEAEIHVAGQLGKCVLEIQLRRGGDVHVEADVIRRRVGRRDGLDRGVGLGDEGSQVEVGADGETRDEDIAAEEEVILRTLELQGEVGQGADALRVANVNAFARNREVGKDSVLIGEVTAERELSTAGHGGEGLNLKAVLIELERAVQLAEAVGQIFKGQRAVLEIDTAFEAGMLQGAVGYNLEGGDAAGSKVGIERFSELEVDGAAGGKIELLRAFERKAPLRSQIGVFAGDVEGIEMNCAVGQRGMRAAFALQRHTGNGDRQLAKVGIAAKLLEIESGPSIVTVPASAESAAEASTCAMRSSAPMLKRENSRRAWVA